MNKDDYLNFTKNIKITKEEFKKVARMVALAYPPKTINDIPFLDSEETFNLWYELLGDVTYLSVYLGMVEYVKGNKYPPTLADIISYSENETAKLYSMDRQIESHLHTIEETMHDYGHYSFSVTGDNYSVFLNYFLKDDLERTLGNIQSFVWFVGDMMKKQGFRAPENIEGWLELWKKD